MAHISFTRKLANGSCVQVRHGYNRKTKGQEIVVVLSPREGFAPASATLLAFDGLTGLQARGFAEGYARACEACSECHGAGCADCGDTGLESEAKKHRTH